MIPNSEILNQPIEIKEQPSRTHRLNIDSNTIQGFIDEMDAMKQAIYLILNTERYQYPIYSWNYGIETTDLFGRPVAFVAPELEGRIKEALSQDTRILSVDSFQFDTTQKRKIQVTFVAHTIFGEIEGERTVEI